MNYIEDKVNVVLFIIDDQRKIFVPHCLSCLFDHLIEIHLSVAIQICRFSVLSTAAAYRSTSFYALIRNIICVILLCNLKEAYPG